MKYLAEYSSQSESWTVARCTLYFLRIKMAPFWRETRSIRRRPKKQEVPRKGFKARQGVVVPVGRAEISSARRTRWDSQRFLVAQGGNVTPQTRPQPASVSADYVAAVAPFA